ncbi:HAD family hydrolase [Haloquadratum walsbyi]|uniref:Haloacid dehalogenase family hydrolase n=1 Tax=Haloquadratum walsbyi J07HQW2 TaxID=1238425 RepID=U1NEQ9_9EURY|nr:HAD family hydrolase [Haloquadratum walsbyi]ERG95515.1 MAG: haloacid dehalogenase family hydrolase [Haloquadratum walsbyi J07HQW2]
MTLTAVGFDLDETLAIPTRDRATILAEAIASVGAPQITREAYLEAHGRHLTSETRTPIFADLLAGRETDVDAKALADAYRHEIADALVPLSGVKPFLRTLTKEYHVGLLTNGPQLAQRDKLQTLTLSELFDVALVTGELSAGKPDPAAFEALTDALGVTAGKTAYVGDDVDADISGAANAGLTPIQVIYDGGPDPTPEAAVHIPRTELCSQLPTVLRNQ